MDSLFFLDSSRFVSAFLLLIVKVRPCYERFSQQPDGASVVLLNVHLHQETIIVFISVTLKATLVTSRTDMTNALNESQHN